MKLQVSGFVFNVSRDLDDVTKYRSRMLKEPIGDQQWRKKQSTLSKQKCSTK